MKNNVWHKINRSRLFHTRHKIICDINNVGYIKLNYSVYKNIWNNMIINFVLEKIN